VLACVIAFAVVVSARFSEEQMAKFWADPQLPSPLRSNFTQENIIAYFTTIPHLTREGPVECPPVIPQNHTLGTGIDYGKIIEIGFKVWDIVKQNQPTSAWTHSWAGAVTEKASSWTQLTGWRDMDWRQDNSHFKYRAVNGFGITTVAVDWRWTWKAGGKYQGGGNFMSVAGAIPSGINVLWGYNLDLGIFASNALNYGTTTNPIAGMTFLLSLKVSTPLQTSTITHTATLKGDGNANCI